jgi:hypothetical protein
VDRRFIPLGEVPDVAIEAVDDPANLGWIRDDGDHRHAASAARASQDVYRVDLGQQPSPGLTAGKRVEAVPLEEAPQSLGD